MTQRVLVTAAYLDPGGEVDQLLSAAGLTPVFARRADREAAGRSLTDAVRDVAGIVAGTDAFTAEVLAAAPGLRVIGRCGVGYDNIDVAVASRNGVAVTNTPGVNRTAVAELVLGLTLDLARGISRSIANVRDGGWDQPSGRELAGATFGVVGFGSIGRTVARLARALGTRVLACDPYLSDEEITAAGAAAVSLPELLRQADFVSLHLFLDGTTRHLIDAAALRTMKPDAYLINTARGGVVDEAALADALAAGELAGAALDVVEREPLPGDSRLRTLDNVLVTAHVGAATREARARSGGAAARQVIDVLSGRAPANLVNPEYAAVLR